MNGKPDLQARLADAKASLEAQRFDEARFRYLRLLQADDTLKEAWLSLASSYIIEATFTEQYDDTHMSRALSALRRAEQIADPEEFDADIAVYRAIAEEYQLDNLVQRTPEALSPQEFASHVRRIREHLDRGVALNPNFEVYRPKVLALLQACTAYYARAHRLA